MDLNSILNTGILAGNTIYLPTVVPVDYGGDFVYTLSLHLTDGTFLCRSSLELDGAGNEQARYDRTLALLRESVAQSGLSPRADYRDEPLTRAYHTASHSKEDFR